MTIKRFFDALSSLLAIGVLLPVWLPIMVLLRLTGEGEIFYFQKRIGWHNEPFQIWKFATMLKNSASMGAGTITLRNDPRVTPVGNWLRKTKLNELPQLVNVLLGDMSVVGPRPLDEKGFLSYPPAIRERVYAVRPGITGIGSIVFRDEEKYISASELPPREYYQQYIAPYKGALELWYQENRSFGVDLLLILLTLWVVFFPHSQIVHRIWPDLPARPSYLRDA